MKALGFAVVSEGGEEYLRFSKTVIVSDMEASLAELNNAIDMLVPKDQSASSTTSFSEEKKTPEGIIIRQQSSTVSAASSSSAATGKMSEKQKARVLMEKKRQREAQEAKDARQKTSNLIKQGELLWHQNTILFYYLVEAHALYSSNLTQKSNMFMRIDKYVRKNDENWTSKQSAACVKSGSGINTFRDKFGEGDD